MMRIWWRLARLLKRCVLLSAVTASGMALAQTDITTQMDAARKAPRVSLAPVKPAWSELNATEQQALSPLATEWDWLDETQKKKWLVISNKFSSMRPEQQQRLQDRMREWSKLTPEQRRVARESYSRAKKLRPSEKTAEWERYQLLTEAQKKQLAREAAAKKRVANLPPASAGKGKIATPSIPGRPAR